VNQIILMSGPPGAGKSAVAEALCERFDRMLHVQVDDLRHMVKAGYRHPWAGDRQAREQLELAARNAAAIALQSAATRYAVVIDDIVTGEAVPWYQDALASSPVRVEFVTLLPALDAIEARNASQDPVLRDRAGALHAQLTADLEAGAIPGVVLDPTGHANAHETADAVQDAISRGRALFVSPDA
jgi:chloramphenicol 3-O-phosphotransferase